MKLTLESIKPTDDSSFKLMVNPRLSDFFFWHFHPEFELVYMEGANGNRHVGDHLSTFQGSDLVMIGSNIPHLNFDYNVHTRYHKMVIHIRADFLHTIDAGTPELVHIKRLFADSAHGIAFGSTTKDLLKERIMQLPTLHGFDRFVEFLAIFDVLAKAEDAEFLHNKEFGNRFSKKEHDRLNKIYSFVETSYNRPISLEEVAGFSHYSKAAFCRFFKKMTKLTFTDFLNNYRISQAKRYLLAGKNVTETASLCGYESLSYFNRVFRRVTKENPLSFKNNHTIR